MKEVLEMRDRLLANLKRAGWTIDEQGVDWLNAPQ